MLFELVLLPFIVGLATNKVSGELFKIAELDQIIMEIYHDTESEFNAKYKDSFGGEYNNFLARQDNLELVLKGVLSLKDANSIKFVNTADFSGDITPEEVVNDFIFMFDEKINQDTRLIQYKSAREHQIITENTMLEIKKLTHIRFRKFVGPEESYLGEVGLETTTIRKLDEDVASIIEELKGCDVVLVDSFRGFGKTETLKRVSFSDVIEEQFDRVIVMRRGIRNIIDAVQSELFSDTNYLIIIDDSDTCRDEFKEVLRFMKTTKVSTKVIASMQTHSVEEMRQIVLKEGLLKRLGG